MAGVRERPRGGRYEGWYQDHARRRTYFTGTGSRLETLEMARHLEADGVQIRLGFRPQPQPHERNLPIGPLIFEYLSAGRQNGGLGGRPWARGHAAKLKQILEWWMCRLGVAGTRDLAGCLTRVEAQARALKAEKTGKTVNHYTGALKTFCAYLVRHRFLDRNPLQEVGYYAQQPATKRRAMTGEEVSRLLVAMYSQPHSSSAHMRALGYEIALSSGLRAGEIRALRRSDLDVVRGGVVLRPEITKNRKNGFQPLSAALMAKLLLVEGGPDAPIAYVPQNAAAALEADLQRAGIPKWGPGGKVDFHALRVAYTTFVIESGATVKEAQELCRHSNPALTIGVYGRAREGRLSEIAERVGSRVLTSDQARPGESGAGPVAG